MIQIEIIKRDPGHHHRIALWKNYPAVPRPGDHIVINDEIVYEVHSIFWNSNKTVQVKVNP